MIKKKLKSIDRTILMRQPLQLLAILCFTLNILSCHANDGQSEAQKIRNEVENVYLSQYPAFVAISPDRTKILLKSYISRQYALQIQDIQSKLTTTIDIRTNGQFAPIWSPSSKKVAFYVDPNAEQDYKLHIYDLLTSKVQPIETPKIIVSRIAWSEDDRYLSYFDQQNRINVIDLHNAGKLVYSSANRIAPELQVDWSRISNSIAYISVASPNIIEISNIDTGKSFSIDIKRKVKIFSWASTTEKLIVASTSDNQSIVELVSENSSTALPIDPIGDISNILPSFDDQYILFGIYQGFQVKYAIYRTSDSAYREYEGEVIDTHSSKNIVFIDGEDKENRRQNGIFAIDLSSLKSETVFKEPKPKPSWALSDEFMIHAESHNIPCFLWRTQGGKHPIIVYIHGGPATHFTSHWTGEYEAFLKSGIDVLLLNYSGSTGYGQQYARELNRAIGDIGDTVSYLREQKKYSDIYLWGSSFGTRLTLEAFNQKQNEISGIFLSSHLGNANNIGTMPKKLLVFHGANDFIKSPEFALSNLKHYWQTTQSDWFHLYVDELHSFRRFDTRVDVMSKIIFEIKKK